MLATLLRQQEDIERSIDNRPPFAVRHVRSLLSCLSTILNSCSFLKNHIERTDGQAASELLHRPPGMDPLGPMVHAWNNILEHPDHEDIEFDERYQRFRLRGASDAVDDAPRTRYLNSTILCYKILYE